MKTFGEIIRTQREKRNLYLRQVAAAIDIDKAIISKFENGYRNPTKEQVKRFAKFYNLNYDELYIASLSDKVVYDLMNEKHANKILQLAEKKMKYHKQTNK